MPPPQRSALTDALALLARLDYSRAGMRDKLRSKGHAADAVEAAVQRCIEFGYLDDAAFGRNRLEARLARRPAGKTDAVRDLRRRGLAATMSESVADEVFEAAGGEAAVLDEAIAHWVGRHGEPPDRAAAKRCFDHLMRRGFPHYLVMQRLSSWLDDMA